MDIAALIPAHNEALSIAQTVRAIESIRGVTRVVVVDDGSEDDTALHAEDAGAKVIRMMSNAGKGAALEAGAKRVANADIVLLLDGDLGRSASQAALLLAPLLAGETDMAIASFPPPTANAGFGLVKSIARFGIRHLGGPFEATAPLSGQRALTRACFATVRPFAAGYGVEVGLTIRALRAGFRVIEVPTTMSHDATGRDVAGFVHRGRQFFHVTAALIKLSFERKPDRLTGDEY